jgi:hypothetical protein
MCASFFPGVTIKLQRIATGDFKAGSKIISKAIQVLGNILSCSLRIPLEHFAEQNVLFDGEDSNLVGATATKAPDSPIADPFSKKWVQVSLANVAVIIRKYYHPTLLRLLSFFSVFCFTFDDSRIRTALLHACEQLLQLKFNQEIQIVLFDCLVHLSQDENEKVFIKVYYLLTLLTDFLSEL